MKSQFNRFSVVVSLFLVPAWAAAMPDRTAFPPDADGQAAAASSTWLDQLLGGLAELYRRMGGDPAKFNLETSLQGKFGLIADQYASLGVPTDLEAPELAALAGCIQQIYTLLSNPPEGLPIASDSFRKVLRLIWTDLGLPPEELGG